MPSRRSRSRSRTPKKKHKKSHKRLRKSRNDSSSASSRVSRKKKEEKTNEYENKSVDKQCLPSSMLPPSILTKLESKEDEPVKASTEEQSSNDSNTQPTKKRKSRWIDDRVILPHMPTTISTANMTEQQQKIYLLQVEIEESTRRLKMNDLGISPNPENRSPSPEPIYHQHGIRQNTREVRTRRKIEDHRHQLITELISLDPNYKPPSDYRQRQTKYTDKVMIPQEDYPDVNFIGLIIGPRGSTLKMLEKETNARIIIRGKGSQKDGKLGLVRFGSLPGENEPLHVYITGNSPEIVAKAVEKINEILNQSIDEPEGLNDLRKQQLRQLALLKGTLRENDSLIKLKLISEAEKIYTNTIICTVCGGAGHVSSDCKFRKKPDGTYVDPTVNGSFLISGNQQERQKLDCEYQSLMNELTGKKDTNTNALSLDDQRNLMSGSRTTGPTLSIGNGSSTADNEGSVSTVGALSFNANGSIKSNNDYNPPSLMSLNTNNSNHQSNPSFNSSVPRYNNNDVFDGYYLLRRTNRNNYSSYIEGDSYRAQHIPALIENDSNYNSKPQNQPWNQYNSNYRNTPSMYPPNTYQQQQYYQHNNQTRFIPPLPTVPPPPPPPPPF